MPDLDDLYKDSARLIVEWVDHIGKPLNEVISVEAYKVVENVGVLTRRGKKTYEKKLDQLPDPAILELGNIPCESPVLRISSERPQRLLTPTWMAIHSFDFEKTPKSAFRPEYSRLLNDSNVDPMPREKHREQIQHAFKRICREIDDLGGELVGSMDEERLPNDVEQCRLIARALDRLRLSETTGKPVSKEDRKEGKRIPGLYEILHALLEPIEDVGTDETSAEKRPHDTRDQQFFSKGLDKKTFRKPNVPTAKHWYEITIRFVNDETIEISNRKDRKKFTCSELGLARQSNKQPCKRWLILLLFADKEGEVPKCTVPLNKLDSFKRQRQLLRANLEEWFGISEDPFEHLEGFQGWKTRFHIERDQCGKLSR